MPRGCKGENKARRKIGQYQQGKTVHMARTCGFPKAGTGKRRVHLPATFRGKWLGALLLVCFVGAVCSSSTFAYENRELAEAARAYEKEIKSQFRKRHGRLSPRDLLILETVVEPLLFGQSGGMSGNVP